MRALLLALLLCVPGLATASDSKAPGIDLDATLVKMNAAYKGVQAITADFVQTSKGISYIEPVTQSGTISLEAPGKMRWDFVTPTKTQYLSDGTTLWVLEEADRKCTEFGSVNEMLQLIYGFLTGTADPREHFKVTVDSEKPPVEGQIALKLSPQEPQGSIESLRVYLDPTSFRVMGVSMLTPFGDRTDTVLANVTTPDDIPDADFVYTAREGWRTVKAD